jgi:acyl-CoA hydrolase
LAPPAQQLLQINATFARQAFRISDFEFRIYYTILWAMPMESDSPAAPHPTFSNYFLVRHQDLNHAGTLFGGRMMAWADELAFIAASLSFPGCNFVTKIFEKFDFIHGPGAGAIIRIDARVLSRGTSSVRVQVSGIWAVDGQPIFTTEAVMVNAHGGHSVPIPGN